MFTFESTQFNLEGFSMVLMASFLGGIRWTLTQVLMQKADLGQCPVKNDGCKWFFVCQWKNKQTKQIYVQQFLGTSSINTIMWSCFDLYSQQAHEFLVKSVDPKGSLEKKMSYM